MIDIINDNFNDLAKDYYKLQEEYEQLEQENKQLKNILTELEEWTKSEYDRYYNDKENLVFSNVEVIDFGRVLDKIQELKEKYK